MPNITADDVYRCQRVERMETNSLDYAVVFLDRPVVNRFPVPVSSARAPVTVGDPITILGFGSGIPLKVDTGGNVIDPRPTNLDYFVASTDTFGEFFCFFFEAAQCPFLADQHWFYLFVFFFLLKGGNSGSGAFDASGTLVGILVRGQTDYVISGNCRIVNVVGCTDELCSKLSDAEELTYAFHAINAAVNCRTNTDCSNGKSCSRACAADSEACTGWCM
jgi:hypothetical protein